MKEEETSFNRRLIMDKFKLSSLAALSLIAGSMAQAEAKCSAPSTSQTQSLYAQLDSAHQSMYDSMDCEGKKLAMKLAEQTCAGKNSCAGLNSCATQNNSCQGKGSCQGQSAGPFKDKNKAIDVAQQYMMNKRAKSMGS